MGRESSLFGRRHLGTKYPGLWQLSRAAAGCLQTQRRDFIGLENPPPTPLGVPGLRFKLIAAQASGLGPGASIIYKGITVGLLETRVFHPESGEVEFNAFINEDYARLVDERTLFYSTGGLDLKVGAEGVQLGGGTLASILSASVTFTEPAENRLRPKALQDGQAFVLYASLDEARKPKLNPTLPYLLLFPGSVRGLNSEASVEFRGIRVGTVVGASFKYFPGDPEHRVPVLMKSIQTSFWIKVKTIQTPPMHRPSSPRAWKKVFAPA